MSELGQDGRKLIERALAEERVASARELSQIRRRVLAASRGVGILGGASQAAAWSGKTLVVATLKAALIGSAAAVVATGVFTELRPASREVERTAPPAVTQTARVAPAAPREVTTPSDAPPNTASNAPVLQQVPARQATKPHRAAIATAPEPVSAPEPTPSRGDSLVSELSLLERVQTELRAGRGAEALSLLDHGDRELEFKQLGAERLAAEVMAACQAGQHSRALAAGRRLMAERPPTPAAARVRTSCIGKELSGEK